MSTAVLKTTHTRKREYRSVRIDAETLAVVARISKQRDNLSRIRTIRLLVRAGDLFLKHVNPLGVLDTDAKEKSVK